MAYQGSSLKGMDFIDDAINSGAIAIAIDEKADVRNLHEHVTVYKVKQLREHVGQIASRYFSEPTHDMNVIGVTGTNGKTTVAYMLSYALNYINNKAAFIGTLGYGKSNVLHSGNMTTPDPINLHALFSAWRNDVETVSMEVSSHALDQARVANVQFDTAVFTNLSHDHIDYHETFENYASAKAKLFHTPGLKKAVINYDDGFGRNLIKEIEQEIEIIAYSTSGNIDATGIKKVCVKEVLKTDDLITIIKIASSWGDVTIKTGLLGDFNIPNVLAVFSTLCANNIAKEDAAKAICVFTGVPGRMECFTSNNKPLLVVDYAHTPDALEKALTSLRSYCKGKLYCVFGCGGDRDTGKRPQMGNIAETLADVVILTNDNPRSEKPERIIAQILAGMQNKERIAVRYDRSDAITNTFHEAETDDIILIAGKGHETTQTIGNDVIPFSDRELARRLVEETA